MPKVVLLMDNPSVPTGYASTCRLTGKELAKRGWDVYALGFNGGMQNGNNGEAIFEFAGIKVIKNYALERNKDAIYGDAETILKVEADIAPDIYFWHNDSYRYSYVKNLPSEITEKSVFWLPFEGEYPDAPGLDIFGRCAAIRFVTKHALALHAPLLKDKDIGSIYHAIDLDHMNPLQTETDKKISKREKKLGIEDKFVVSRVDRHQPRKYWNLTLEAFAKFAKDKDDVFLIGKCNPRDCTMYSPEGGGIDLEKVATSLGIEKKIAFDDFFFDVSYMAKAFYHPADVFLTTTSGEGFGLALAEAMACGIPVLYHDTPVLPEIVGDGGIMFARKERKWYEKMSVWHNIADVDSCTAALETAYQDWKKDRSLLVSMGKKARERAEQNFSPKVVYDKWDVVMRDVIEKRDMISLVTVLYNVSGKEQIYGEDGIEKLRLSIEKYVKSPYEWIIVDNCSPEKEETQKWLTEAAEKNRHIKPVFLTINRGYAGGNNVGISMAGGKYVVLMNPDSEAIPPEKHGFKHDFAKLMRDRMEANQEIGILGMDLKERDDVLPGAKFPYFCCVMISKTCLDAIKLADGKWLDENYWPAYYEDLDLCIRAQGKGFKIVEDGTLPFWHKSGGTNKYLVQKSVSEPAVKSLLYALERLKKEGKMALDFDRKFGELASGGMQGLIEGNIKYLNSKWGASARQKIKVVWDTHIGEAVGFSELAEGLIPELDKLGFDVYVNDWTNGSKITNPVIKRLWEKTKKAKETGEDLYEAVHIVCWLMETFADVEGSFKAGISLCESTKVRASYLHLCNSMDQILTFSQFCKSTQRASGFNSPIHVIPPAVASTYINYHERGSLEEIIKRKGKFTFLCVGVSQGRKDTFRLVEAFAEAFPKGQKFPPERGETFPITCDQVELVLKSNNFGELSWVHDKGFSKRANVRTIFTGWDHRAERPDLTPQEMYDLYCNADALVHPSHGEGIGMPILEGGATGLPVIFTNWSSPSEYFNDSNSYPISLSPYPGTTFTKAYPEAPGDNGVWANMHVGHMKHLMYTVIVEWDKAREVGKRAHEKVKKNYTWSESVRHLWPAIMEWDECRKTKPKRDNQFDPMTFVRPVLEPVTRNDRILIDVATRDRHPYLACLLVSLLHQTFKNWDIVIQVDDADESILQDHLIMSLLNRAQNEGHGWRMHRSHRQGPHIAHQRTLQVAIDDNKKTKGSRKLVCRIDDDIYVQPDYLEKLFDQFLADTKCELGAVSGVYLDPRRPDEAQVAPANYKQDVNYAGLIDHNVPWPYICKYPPGAKPRSVEHLYSSYLYRVEVAEAIGGYCKLFSQIGHREESDFSYRFWLAGYALKIHPDAVGFHFSAPNSGIRSVDINEKNALAETDHKIYTKRLTRWKQRLAERRELEQKKSDQLRKEADDIAKKADESRKAARLACVINCGADVGLIKSAIKRFSPIADSIYVTCEAKSKNEFSDIFSDPVMASKIKAIGNTPEESALIAQSIASRGEHEFVMTVSDQMEFSRNPRSILSENYDEYVFEVYETYLAGRMIGNVFSPEKDGPKMIGRECRNSCLIYRRGSSKPPIEKILYSDIMVLEDTRHIPKDDNSRYGNSLIRLDDINIVDWTKICVFQHPEGPLNAPKTKDVSNGSPLVSIIIPTPGRKDHLKRCIDSIYALTTTSFELIIVDNGSSDGTQEMVEKQAQLRHNIVYMRQGSNLGFQKGVNIGVSRSRGKYILIFNDDAWIEKPEPQGGDWLSVLMAELDANPKVGIVGPHEDVSPALGKNILMFWCVMLRRSTWDEIGPLDDVTFMNYGGDDDYCERLRQKGYEVKTKYVHLRHLMNLVPHAIKEKELAESRVKLRSKYNVAK